MRKKKKPLVLDEENMSLWDLVSQTNEHDPLTPYERLQIEVQMAIHSRLGEMNRHLQEIEGNSWRR
jgi:hypothetical protein